MRDELLGYYERELTFVRQMGAEFARMTRHGRVSPDLWMENATGAPVGTAALFRMTEKALSGK